ncbi:unnamed protein product [Spirodela intermedia]|uniref:Ubiquitin carboxyl-terminal hydrolase n=1 Tax=Spirodela intermedia TaxID=51605 RepID=A0A7I8LFL6_SPIIN|nr:unnamed protein product [Spirodela intermedia]
MDPMTDGAAVKTGKSRGGLPPLALFTVVSGGILSRKIEFHTARTSFSGFGVASGEILKPGVDPSAASASSDVGPSSGGQGKRSDAGELQCGLDPELRFEISFRRIGAGLANLGNTCFLNSVLQCLTYTEPFAAYLQSGKHTSSCRTAGFCALCALQNHVVDALQSTGKILRPFHLVKNLRCISRNFRNSRQEDAHEYMINLLEAMHKCCLPSGVASESASAYEKSLVHKIFGGRFRSQVKCMQCSYYSNTFDPFLDLSLEIVKADTLCKALSHFISEEQLDGGEKQYHCLQCNQKVRALKKLTIHKAPNVLTIHLKRFGSHVSGQKIGKQVQFEPKLNLKPYVSDPLEGDLMYTLYGVLVHAGYGTHSGHYYCFIRIPSGMWYSLNDDQVSQVSEKTVLQQKAYMLFYVRNISSAPKMGHDITRTDSRPSTTSAKVESTPLKGISDAEHLLKKVSILPTSTHAAKAQQSKGSSNVRLSHCGRLSSDYPHISLTLCIGSSCSQDAVIYDQESKDQATARVRESTLNEARAMDHRKGLKSSHLRNISFGPRRFLLLSLTMQKKKRCSRRRNQSLTTGSIRKSGIPEGNNDPGGENAFSAPGDVNSLGSGQPNTMDVDLIGPERGLSSEAGQHSTVEAGTSSNSLRNRSLNPFTRNFGELSGWARFIPRWDDIDLQPGIQLIDDEPSSVGYVLDEEEKEYDRGRRKKVRRPRDSFSGPNPFEELAVARTQKKTRTGRGGCWR